MIGFAYELYSIILFLFSQGKCYNMKRKVKAAFKVSTFSEKYVEKERGIKMADLKPADIRRVKAMGFLKNTTNDGFSMRVLTKNGVLTAAQWKNLSEVADKWGNGTLSLTTRLTVEIPAIQYEDIEAAQNYIVQEGMVTGGTGDKVRPVVACKGTVCKFGNCDTQAIAEKIHDRFFVGYENVKLPHKFKIAVGGCPNNCVKPDLNDFGLMGVHYSEFDKELCRGCKKCAIELNCPMGAASVVDGKMTVNPEICNHCGRCVGKCYFHAVKPGTKAFRIFIGGRWGKKTRHGSMLPGVYTEEEALDVIEKTMLLFREKGQPKERLAALLDRVGEEAFFDELLHGDVLARKEEILKDGN